MNVHQRSSHMRISPPRVAQKRKSLTVFGFSMREILLILIIAFPCMGTLFPLDSYLIPIGLNGIVAKTPFNTTLILTAILLYVFWLFAQDMPKALRALRRNWVIFVFILWAMITSRWAETPGTSFNRSGRSLVFTLYAVYFLEYIPYRRSLQILFLALGISAVFSLLMIAGYPALSLTTDERGAWRGAMQHKNGLGITVAIGFAVSILCAYLKIYPWKICAGLAVLSLLLLKLANSATAILALGFVLPVAVVILFVVNRTRHPLVTLFSATVAVVAVGGAVATSGIVFELLGREGTLTGRADIWTFAWGMIDENPFWGYGQGAWTFEWMKKLAYAECGWPIAHAHNAWIDFRFQLGVPGLALAILMWALATFNMLRLIAVRQAMPMILPMAVFMILTFRTYSETIIVDPALNDIFWFAFSYAAFAKLVAELPLRRPAQSSRPIRGYAMARERLATRGSLGEA